MVAGFSIIKPAEVRPDLLTGTLAHPHKQAPGRTELTVLDRLVARRLESQTGLQADLLS